MREKSEILVIGMGAVGTMAAYALSASDEANVTVVCRSNYEQIISSGCHIESIDHGIIPNWKPQTVLNAMPNTQTKLHQYQTSSK